MAYNSLVGISLNKCQCDSITPNELCNSCKLIMACIFLTFIGGKSTDMQGYVSDFLNRADNCDNTEIQKYIKERVEKLCSLIN